MEMSRILKVKQMHSWLYVQKRRMMPLPHIFINKDWNILYIFLILTDVAVTVITWLFLENGPVSL